ncbi:MAG: hypothetical protein J07HX5_01787 [halophilic archaeon J07HX5]|jgi:hypothetical protein|nr:MAG: hypothetical protein J07HX5_01787 [halophilic archaeon J07HX5]
MALDEQARDRLADILALQPTKNGTLQEQWGLDSGSAVHQYLEAELGEYYYRDEDSLIRATPAAESLVGETTTDQTVVGTRLHRRVLDALPESDAEPQSVVATLHAVRETGDDPGVDAVRSALHELVDRGVVERLERTVPTFRRAVDREAITIAVD